MAREVTLRPASMGDLDTVTEYSRAVKWPHRSEDIALMMSLGSGVVAIDVETSRKAGVGYLWPQNELAATLGLVIVDPACQGGGVGRVIMSALFDKAGSRGISLIATAAGRPLYQKLGFEETGFIVQQQGDCTREARFAPGVRKAQAEDFDQIVSLDAGACGVERRALLSALSDAGEIVVLERDSALTGYAVRRRFGRGAVIGPIAAVSEADGIVLIEALQMPGFIRVDRMGNATEIGAFLDSVGMTSVDEPVAMQRGDRPSPKGPAKVLALSSQALG